MCGIAGIYGANARADSLLKMQKALVHRGPDGDGIFSRIQDSIYLAHNRLSIIDLSKNGTQPMQCARNRFTLIFNGEIYNYIELKEELKDYPFKSSSDSEVILASYERWGIECLTKLMGMFAFVIWDNKKKELFCARDHVGIKPFYYSWFEGTFYFASEIKALLAAGLPCMADEELIYAYLCDGNYDHTQGTFFKNIQSLSPGCAITLKEKNFKTIKYWDLSKIIKEKEANQWNDDETLEKTRSLLEASVKMHLRSDVPLGIHLTGGLDSSTLLSIAARHNAKFTAFTGTYRADLYDESKYALEISACLNIKHQNVPIEIEKFWQIAENTQRAQEQPFGGLATMVYWEMEKSIRENGIKVVLEGQGADEIFGGYSYYWYEHCADLLRQHQYESLEKFLKSYAVANSLDYFQLKKSFSDYCSGDKVRHQDGSLIGKTDYLNKDFHKRFESTQNFDKPSNSSFTNARFRDLTYSKLPRVLRFNDRMSMAWGIELRVPYLDKHIIETSFEFSNDFLLAQGNSKWPLRQLATKYLPSGFKMSPKRAVVTPQREWLRGVLKKKLDVLSSESLGVKRGFISENGFKNEIEKFCDRKIGDNSSLLWRLINLELWLEAFNPA